MRNGAADAVGIKITGGKVGLGQRHMLGRLGRGTHGLGEGLERRHAVIFRAGEDQRVGVLRGQPAFLAGIGEEGDRVLGAHQDELLGAFEEFLRLLGEIGNAFKLHPACAPLHARGEGIAHDARAGGRLDAPGQLQPVFQQHPAAQQDRRLFAVLERGGHLVDLGSVHRVRGIEIDRMCRLVRVQPGGVGGQDQCRDTARCAHRRCIGASTGSGHVAGVFRRFHPHRIGAGNAGDVGGERGVILAVIGRVFTHHIDDGGGGTAGVVEIGKAIAQPRAQMQQGCRGLAGHAAIAVSRARYHTFEQAEHRADAVDAVQRGHEVHFRRAGIGEADFHAAIDEGLHQAFRTVHVAQLPVCPDDVCFERPVRPLMPDQATDI